MSEWLIETFEMDAGFARGVQFFIAVLIVLALIAVFVWILRRITGSRLSGNRNRQPRIAVMDATGLDARRRLVLIRRDNVEHLLLIGGPTDVVVEQNIVRGVPVSANYPRPGQPVQMSPEASAPAEPAAAAMPPQPAPQPAAALQQPPQPRPAARPPQRPEVAQRPEAPQRPVQPLRSPAAPQPSQQRAPSSPAPGPQDRQAPASTQQRRAGAAVAAAGAAVAHLARDMTSKAPPAEKTASQQPRPSQVEEKSPAREPHRSVSPPSSGPAASARSAFPQRPQQQAPQPPRAPVAPRLEPGATPSRADVKMSAAPEEMKPTEKAPAAPPVMPERTAGPGLDLTGHLEESLRGALDQPAEMPAAPEAKASPELRAVRDEPKIPLQRAAPEVAAPQPPAERKPVPASPPAPAPLPEGKAAAPDVEVKKPDMPTSGKPGQEPPLERAAGAIAPSKDQAVADAADKMPELKAPRPEEPAVVGGDTKPEVKPETKAAPEGELPADTAETKEDREPGESAKAEDVAPDTKKKNDPVTIDAIEEEMAKLLNEISGNRNK